MTEEERYLYIRNLNKDKMGIKKMQDETMWEYQRDDNMARKKVGYFTMDGR